MTLTSMSSPAMRSSCCDHSTLSLRRRLLQSFTCGIPPSFLRQCLPCFKRRFYPRSRMCAPRLQTRPKMSLSTRPSSSSPARPFVSSSSSPIGTVCKPSSRSRSHDSREGKRRTSRSNESPFTYRLQAEGGLQPVASLPYLQ
jgi:hypothetical protein